MVVNTPRTIHVVVPYTLQVGRHVAWTRRGDEQIAAKLIVELLQIEILCPLAVVSQSLIDWHIVGVIHIIQIQAYTIEETAIILVMLLQQLCVTLAFCLAHPAQSSSQRIHAHIGFRIIVIRIIVCLVIGIGRNEEYHLVSTLHGQLSTFVRQVTTLVDGTDADSILHIVVIETCIPKQPILAISHHLACRYRVRRIREYEILPARTGSLVADSHHIGWIRNEILTLIVYTILDERNGSQCRIERQGTAIFGHTHSAQSCLDIRLTHRGKATETEWIFCIRLVWHRTVEVLAGELGCLFPIVGSEGISDFLHHMGRILVHIPIIGSALLGVRTATPERLLIQRDALSLHGTQDIGSDTTITDRQ